MKDTQKRGRKHIRESRTAEIRFYLERLEEWQLDKQAKEYQRQAKAIRDQADAEKPIHDQARIGSNVRLRSSGRTIHDERADAPDIQAF